MKYRVQATKRVKTIGNHNVEGSCWNNDGIWNLIIFIKIIFKNGFKKKFGWAYLTTKTGIKNTIKSGSKIMWTSKRNFKIIKKYCEG